MVLIVRSKNDYQLLLIIIISCLKVLARGGDVMYCCYLPSEET